MNQEIVSAGAAAGTLLSASASIAFFWKLLNTAQTSVQANPNPVLKKRLEKHCLNPRLEFVEFIASSLQHSFERFFGNKFNFRFFKTSILFSLATVLGMTLLWSAISPMAFAKFLDDDPIAGIAAIFTAALMLNLLPDIISLWQTSVLVGALSRYKKDNKKPLNIALFTIACFFIDVLLTTAIASFVLYLFSIVHSKTFLVLLENALMMRSFEDGAFSVGIFFYSTFATTCWVGLWTLASALQISERIWARLIKLFTSIFDSTKDPFAPIFMSIKTLVFFLIGAAYALNLGPFIGLLEQLLTKLVG